MPLFISLFGFYFLYLRKEKNEFKMESKFFFKDSHGKLNIKHSLQQVMVL